jgi:predicted ATP-dependent serine protease
MTETKFAVHQLECGVCGTKTILGIRYNCRECFAEKSKMYNVCAKCKITDTFSHHHSKFVKIGYEIKTKPNVPKMKSTVMSVPQEVRPIVILRKWCDEEKEA